VQIGIDIGPITSDRTGVGNYCYYVLKHMAVRSQDCTFKGFASGRRSIALGEIAPLVPYRHVPVPTRLLYALWNVLGVPGIDTLRGGVDVYHATNYFLPPTLKARRVVTVHDLAFLAHPALCSPRIVGPFSRNIRRFVRDAHAVLVYSESTKRDIMRLLEVDSAKITVAPMAADDGFAPLPRDRAIREVEARYGLKQPYILAVGTLEPRKNIAALFRAFAQLADDVPHTLALAGGEGWKSAALLSLAEKLGISGRVMRAGFVPHSRLPALYCAADVLAFPSWYEGFGLPVLEALTCGCPVVAANNSAIPEVAGDAAIYVDADDVDGLAGGIRRVLEDTALRETMVTKGKERARRFSWDDCADATLATYAKVVSC